MRTLRLSLTTAQEELLAELESPQREYCEVVIRANALKAKSYKYLSQAVAFIDQEKNRPEYRLLWDFSENFVSPHQKDFFVAFVVLQGRSTIKELENSSKARKNIIDHFLYWKRCLPQTKKETLNMATENQKLRAAAALCMSDITTVEVAFNTEGTRYTFLCPNDVANVLRQLIGSGEARAYAEVSKNGNIKTVEVVAVHDEPEIDPDGNFEYRWVFGVVDTRQLNKLKDEHDRLFEAIRKQRRHSVREGILASLGIDREQVAKLANERKDSPK